MIAIKNNKQTMLLLVTLLALSTGFAAYAMEHDKNMRGLKFVVAAIQGSLVQVQRFIRAGVDVNYASTDDQTAIMYAAQLGHLAVVECLLFCGADVNAKSIHGKTALMRSTHGGHVKMVKYLVANGADVNAIDIDGKTALICAADAHQTGCCEALVEIMLRTQEMQSKARKKAFCFLCCCKKAKDEGSILACLPKDIVQLIAKRCWVKLTKTREEIKAEVAGLGREWIRKDLLDKYFPENEIKN